MRLSTALLGVFALSGLLACSKPSPVNREEPPARSVAESETSERSDAPLEPDPVEIKAEDAILDSRDAVRRAELEEDKKKQHQAFVDIERIGRAFSFWISDKPYEGRPHHPYEPESVPYDPNDVPLISSAELERLLSKHLSKIPDTDPWGHPYEFRLNVNDPYSRRSFMVRSPGRDGVFATEPYGAGTFDPDDVDQDIVFAGTRMIRKPTGASY